MAKELTIKDLAPTNARRGGASGKSYKTKDAVVAKMKTKKKFRPNEDTYRHDDNSIQLS